MGKVQIGTVEMIGEERATFTARFPTRAEHKVIDDQLTATAEKFREAFEALGGIKFISPIYADPGELASLRTEFVVESGKLLFFRE